MSLYCFCTFNVCLKGFWILALLQWKLLSFSCPIGSSSPPPSVPVNQTFQISVWFSKWGQEEWAWSMKWLRVNKENWVLSKGDPVHQVSSCTFVSSQEISGTCQDQSSSCWQSPVLYAWKPVQTSSRKLNLIYENHGKKSTTFFYSLDAVPFISNIGSKPTSNVSF